MGQREGSSKISNFLPKLKVPYMKILPKFPENLHIKVSHLSLRTLPADSPKWTHLEEEGVITPILTQGLVVSLEFFRTRHFRNSTEIQNLQILFQVFTRKLLLSQFHQHQ